MSLTLAAALVPSAHRPIAVRMRPDLDAHEQVYEGRRFWVVKDPLTLRYYRFQEEEYALLAWLDGQVSQEELRKKFERQFAPQKISTGELHSFLGTLYRASLVISDAAGQAEQLIARQDERNVQKRREVWSNILAIRFRGFNPDNLLTWLNEQVGWLFSLPAVLSACLLGLCALLLVFVEFETFSARLPSFHEFFTLQNGLYLSIALALVKVLHEFGHGISCKRLGGECNEMGVMLLVFSPCLYANVSDAWTLPDKWKRAAIGAAGMYVELILASLATFIWWSTKPGLVHYLALDVMFVCSISTLVFNANPLMRFDGYYILSDLLEIPNLRTKATRILQTKLSAWMLGLKAPHDPFLPRKNQLLFMLFAFTAGCYGWLVTGSILWTLLKMFEPYGFKIMGMVLASAAAYAMVVQPLLRLIKFLTLPGRNQPVNKLRAMISASVMAALVLSLVWLPLPRYVTCGVVVEPQAATAVYVDVPGNVREVLALPFSEVSPGQPLLRLENVDLEIALAQLTGERAQMAARLEGLRERSLVDDEAAELVAHTEEALAALDEQLARKEVERQRLTIYAPAAGVLTPPAPRRAEQRYTGRLAVWSGHPLELRNVGAHLPLGTVIGQIGNAAALQASLAIDETDIDAVRVGQPVTIVLDELPGKRLTTKINTLSADELEIAPAAFSAKHGGALETRTDEAGQERPVNTTYQACAAVTDASGQIVAGARGTAKIAVGRETLGRRLWRELSRTLAWEL